MLSLESLPVLDGRNPETTEAEAAAAFAVLAELGERKIFAGSFAESFFAGKIGSNQLRRLSIRYVVAVNDPDRAWEGLHEIRRLKLLRVLAVAPGAVP